MQFHITCPQDLIVLLQKFASSEMLKSPAPMKNKRLAEYFDGKATAFLELAGMITKNEIEFSQWQKP